MSKIVKLHTENHFGGCPVCRKNDGHLNIGRDHWYICHRHHVKWYVGSCLFPDWQNETQKTWKQNEELLTYYMDVEPLQAWLFPEDEALLPCRSSFKGDVVNMDNYRK